LSSVAGRLKAVIEHHEIQLKVVDVPSVALEKLVTAQLGQRSGMEAGEAGWASP
jgi:hypothetical protein